MKKTTDLKRKRLELSQETIRALTAVELSGVEGGIVTGEVSETLEDTCTRKDC